MQNAEHIVKRHMGFLLSIIDAPDMSVRTRLEVSPASEDKPERNYVFVDIEAPESAPRLIGRDGIVLMALEHLAQRLAEHEMKESSEEGNSRLKVTVDVAGYRARTDERLLSNAARIAERAMEEGGRHAFMRLMPAERRKVHLFIAEKYPELMTVSEGNDKIKLLAIEKKT